MRHSRISISAAVLLLAGMLTPVYAQHDDRDNRSRRHEERRHGRHSERDARDWQERRGWHERGGWGEHDTWHEHRSEQWERDHRTWSERGGYGGLFISAPAFSLYFGPRHYFRMHRPDIYMGHPRFYYQGSAFIMVDPWPAEWGERWYDDDDVYIDYDDGYYLHNRRHPEVSLAVSIVK